MEAKLLFTHALTSLHAGIGQGMNVIDQPIARETATGIPMIPGSSVKGVLRDKSRQIDKDICLKVFGPETTNGDLRAGMVQISDQHLLLVPIRSLSGTFAWVTSPFTLARLHRDCRHLHHITDLPSLPPSPKKITTAYVGSQAKKSLAFAHKNEAKIVLEDIDLVAMKKEVIADWAIWFGKQLFPDNKPWQELLARKLCFVHDDMLNFLLQTATQIQARIRLEDDSKTVKDGGLWYEEALPSETILTGFMTINPVKKAKLSTTDAMEHMLQLTQVPVQLGGNATIGQGICQIIAR